MSVARQRPAKSDCVKTASSCLVTGSARLTSRQAPDSEQSLSRYVLDKELVSELYEQNTQTPRLKNGR